MKRYIRANSYQNEADKALSHIKIAADALIKIAESEDDEDLGNAVQNLGRYYRQYDKAAALDSIIDQLEYLIEDYKEKAGKARMLPFAKEELLDFCKTQGYSPVKLSKSDWGDESYRLSTDAEFGDHHKLCSAIQKKFGATFDTGLGGSWTAHSGNFDGIRFTVGFERDYDLDPEGKERTLQIYF